MEMCGREVDGEVRDRGTETELEMWEGGRGG